MSNSYCGRLDAKLPGPEAVIHIETRVKIQKRNISGFLYLIFWLWMVLALLVFSHDIVDACSELIAL